MECNPDQFKEKSEDVGNGWKRTVLQFKAPKGEYEKAIEVSIGKNNYHMLFGGDSYECTYDAEQTDTRYSVITMVAGMKANRQEFLNSKDRKYNDDKIKTLMIWIGLLLSLASCKDSLEAITLGGDELPTEGVTLSIQLPNFTPQEISTRAGGETTESITSLWLVCYDTSDNYLDMQDCTKAYADATADADGYKKIKTNLPKGTETVHLVANVPGLTKAQAAKLDAMEDITPDLSKPICWGKAKLSDLMNDSKISLTRQCAKVTVQTSVSDFEITDLHVWHSASKGSIAPAGYEESKNENLATSTELMDDSKCITGEFCCCSC